MGIKDVGSHDHTIELSLKCFLESSIVITSQCRYKEIFIACGGGWQGWGGGLLCEVGVKGGKPRNRVKKKAFLKVCDERKRRATREEGGHTGGGEKMMRRNRGRTKKCKGGGVDG